MHRKKLEIAAAALILITIAVGYMSARDMIAGANLEERWAAIAAGELGGSTAHKLMLWLEAGLAWILAVKIVGDLLARWGRRER